MSLFKQTTIFHRTTMKVESVSPNLKKLVCHLPFLLKQTNVGSFFSIILHFYVGADFNSPLLRRLQIYISFFLFPSLDFYPFSLLPLIFPCYCYNLALFLLFGFFFSFHLYSLLSPFCCLLFFIRIQFVRSIKTIKKSSPLSRMALKPSKAKKKKLCSFSFFRSLLFLACCVSSLPFPRRRLASKRELVFNQLSPFSNILIQFDTLIADTQFTDSKITRKKNFR